MEKGRRWRRGEGEKVEKVENVEKVEMFFFCNVQVVSRHTHIEIGKDVALVALKFLKLESASAGRPGGSGGSGHDVQQPGDQQVIQFRCITQCTNATGQL